MPSPVQVQTDEVVLDLSHLAIAFVIYGAIEQHSGGYFYDRQLIAELARCGARVEILSLDAVHGIEIDDAAMAWISFDLIIQDELCHRHLVAVNRRLHERATRPTILALIHNLSYRAASGDERERRINVEKAYLASCDAWVVNSQHTATTALAIAQEPRPFIVAYPALAPWFEVAKFEDRRAMYERCDASPQTPFLLSVGHLSPLKGTLDLVKALARCRDRQWHLDLVGRMDVDPIYVDQVQQAIAELGLASRITLRGHLIGDALIEAYARADAMVLASPEEGFGLAYLEALHLGLPVVASQRGAAGELIAPDGNGWLFNPDEPASLVAMLEQCLIAITRSGEEWAMRRGIARLSVRKHPTWQEVGREVARFILHSLHHSRVRLAMPHQTA